MRTRLQRLSLLVVFVLTGALALMASTLYDSAVSGASNPPTSVLGTVTVDPSETPPDANQATDDETPVEALVEANGRYYIAGNFIEVGGEPRSSLAAIEVSTGQLDPNFNPIVTGSGQAILAMAISPDGADLFIAGKFLQVNGTQRTRVAKLDAHTGALREAFTANANKAVETIATDGASVWVGGAFEEINNVAVDHLAKLDASTGAVDGQWTGTADGSVLDVELHGSDLWVGGNFDNIAGTATAFLARLDASTGAVNPAWSPAHPEHQKVLALSPAPDGSTIFVGTAGTASTSGNAVRAYAADGAVLWQRIGGGDVQAIEATDTTIYGGTHGQFQFSIARLNLDGTPNNGTAADSDLTDPPFSANGYQEDSANANAVRREKFFSLDATTGDLLPWDPKGDSIQGVWELESGPSGLLAGGEFRTIFNPTGTAGEQSAVFVPHFAVFAGLGTGGNAAPEPLFSVDCAGTACNFDASRSLDDGSIASYEWTFPGQPPATGVVASAILADNSIHEATLTVTDDGGLSAERSQRVIVGNGGLPITHVGTTTTSGSNSIFTVDLPATAQVGDVSVALVSVSLASSNATAPAGWVEAASEVDGNLRTVMFWRSLSASDIGASTTFGVSPSGKANLVVTTFRGVDGTNPFAAVAVTPADNRQAEHSSAALSFTGDAVVLHYWAERTSMTTELFASPELAPLATEIGVGNGRSNSTLALDPLLRTNSAPAKVSVAEHHGSTALGWAIALAPGTPILDDTTAPSTTIDQLTAPSGSVTITGTATDTESGVATVRARIKRLADNTYWNGTTWVTSPNTWPTATGTTTWNTTLTLNPGNYTITAYAIDNDGNVQSWANNRPTETIAITGNDTTAPSTTIDQLTAPSGSVTITGTATDTESGVATVRARIKRLADNTYWNGTTWVTSPNTWPTATGTTTWNTTLTLNPGNYTITAYAIDNDGNVQSWANNRPTETIAITGNDTTAPSTTIDQLTAPSGSVTITGTATDTESGVATVRARIKRLADNTYWNGTTWVTSPNTWPTATGTTTWNTTLTLNPGNYTITAYAIDNDDNVQSWANNRPTETITIT